MHNEIRRTIILRKRFKVDDRQWYTVSENEPNTVRERIMSFMYMINRRGPKMEPCGTPTVMSFFVDCVLFISTYCFLLVK